MLAVAAKLAYTREEVRRVLGISERQLRSWERQCLIVPRGAFGFSDLLAMRTLLKLRENRVPAARVRAMLASLRQKLRGVENPLTEIKIFSDGKKIAVQVEGRRMEAISGQLLFDFDQAEIQKLLSFPGKAAGRAEQEQKRRDKVEAERWFSKGLDLEQGGAPIDEAIGAYEQAIALDEASVGALVNLGTIHFNARRFPEAQAFYERALTADPNYHLAHFNLANLFDERGDRANAFLHYHAAIKAYPGYADAHYNLALLYQVTGSSMKAVYHWKTYLKLDPGSPWAVIARRELEKLRQATVLEGNSGRPAGGRK